VTVALNGNLRDFGISEVFQLIGQQRKTGTLRVREGAREFELHFDEGRIVSAAPCDAPGVAIGDMLMRCGVIAADVYRKAKRSVEPEQSTEDALVSQGHITQQQLREIEDLLTRETLFDLLRWVEGSFHFVAQAAHHRRPADSLLPAEQVLMEGLRMVDEWAAFANRAPSSNTLLRRRGSLEEFRSSQAASTSPNPPETEKIFLLIDGRSPVSRVIDLSRLGTFLATRVVVELMRAGWIEAVNDRRRGMRAAGAPRVPVRSLLANLLPLLLLAALALGLERPMSTPAASVVSLDRDFLLEAQHRFSAVRMRNLIEAYRLAEGHWPRQIQPLQLWAAAAGALTPLENGPYYFRRRDQGPVLLAPEPRNSSGAHTGRAR
jgi:hypothetical protein